MEVPSWRLVSLTTLPNRIPASSPTICLLRTRPVLSPCPSLTQWTIIWTNRLIFISLTTLLVRGHKIIRPPITPCWVTNPQLLCKKSMMISLTAPYHLMNQSSIRFQKLLPLTLQFIHRCSCTPHEKYCPSKGSYQKSDESGWKSASNHATMLLIMTGTPSTLFPNIK